VRHPNVASVFHLGTSSNNYFYAMELVDGEPLNKLVRRSGRLEAKLALEITTQVAAGLAAVHKQNLVHRDIKPSNIMVSLDGESVTAKIIDLGLAKAPAQSQSETVGSIPGSFAGTPEFASPEQFAGVGVDIRSDLYSLGVTLWQMLSGKLPFRGTPAELMHQHLHGPLTLEQLTGVPQPVVVLLKVLLEKDPAQRFQSPVELLRVMPTIDIAVADGRTIEHKCLGKVTSEPMRLRQTATEDLTAYDLYLRGIALVELLDRATNQKAIDVLKTAIDRDPNFALAHAGLARAYLERNIRFGAEKSLLDSAVESCRLAIALDPNEVCSYTLLAQAYYSKGWYPQGDQALRKALDLAPDDGRANNLAGDRRFSREEFDKAHAFFRKAQSVSPNEPRWAYRLAEFCWKIDEPDLAERWMQIALEKDTNPHRHRVREIAGMMFRREFAAARAAFAQLPPELQGYDSYTFEYFLTCTMCVGDWPTVIRSINSYLEENPNAIWPRIYLAIALQKADRKAEAREIAEQVAKRGLNRLKQPGEPDVPLEVPLYIACAYRLLNRKGDAYHFLAKYLADSSFLDLCFGLNDPILDPFRADPEFEPIRMNLNNKIEIARLAINEQEAASAQGPPLVEEFSSRQKNHLQSKRPNGVLPYCRSTL
jgi:Tfp pilus assembly protein PilF